MAKITMYLMNKKGLEVLNNIITEELSNIIEYVVLAKDSAVEKDYYDELVQVCDNNSIKHFDRKEEFPSFSGYKFVIGWRWIISDSNKLIVLHDSILPKYRGFSPLVNMLINGEKEIGVTALFADQEYDKGPIILQKRTKIRYPIKIHQAIEVISSLYQKTVFEIINKILNNEMLEGIEQKENEATYSIWRDENDYVIDWSQDAELIKRSIDALGFPYNGAKTRIDEELITIDEAEVIEDVVIENRHVGKIIFFKEGYPVVICGQGLLKITKARTEEKTFNLSKMKFRTRFGGAI